MLAALVFTAHTLTTFDGRPHPAEKAMLDGLAVVRLRTTSEHPQPPIVFLSPGPGIPANILGRVPVYFQLFDKLREKPT